MLHPSCVTSDRAYGRGVTLRLRCRLRSQRNIPHVADCADRRNTAPTWGFIGQHGLGPLARPADDVNRLLGNRLACSLVNPCDGALFRIAQVTRSDDASRRPDRGAGGHRRPSRPRRQTRRQCRPVRAADTSPGRPCEAPSASYHAASTSSPICRGRSSSDSASGLPTGLRQHHPGECAARGGADPSIDRNPPEQLEIRQHLSRAKHDRRQRVFGHRDRQTRLLA
jgi:hypothetical protein